MRLVPSCLALALLLPLPAAAQSTEPPSRAFVRRGLQLQGALALTSCTDDVCDDGDAAVEEYEIGAGLLASVFFRPIEMFAVGLSLHGSFLGTDDQPGVDASSTFFLVDVGGRFHFLQRGPIDPFVGLSFGWAFASTSYESNLDDGDFGLDGPVGALQVGGEYYVTPAISVGLLFRYVIAFWSTYCYDSDRLGDDCLDVDDADDDGLIDEDDLPDAWTIGATVSAHVPL